MKYFNIILESWNKQISASGHALYWAVILQKSTAIMKRRAEPSSPSHAEHGLQIEVLSSDARNLLLRIWKTGADPCGSLNFWQEKGVRQRQVFQQQKQSLTEENAKESSGFVKTLTVRLDENEHCPRCYLVSPPSSFGRRLYSATTRSHRIKGFSG